MLAAEPGLASSDENIDVEFYLGCMLYPQDMIAKVDAFFDCPKEERVKLRKVHRAKIKKVHEVLYKYSHEKMDFFVSMPALAKIFIFYYHEAQDVKSDAAYSETLEHIYSKCCATLRR